MKQFLLVIGFVLGTVLFFNQSEKAQPFDVLSALTKEAVMEDSETKDMQTCLAVLTLSLIHISEPTDQRGSRMPSSA